MSTRFPDGVTVSLEYRPGAIPDADLDRLLASVAPLERIGAPAPTGTPAFPRNDGPGVRHRAGGPYKTPDQVRDALLGSLQCTLGGPQASGPPGTLCERVDLSG